jgi:hypothetical protein
MNFTLNNHVKYYIGDRLYGYRKHPHEKYVVETGKIDKEYYSKSNYLQELYRTADLVTQDLGKSPNVMFSGGTDSEMVLRSLKHVGATPNVFFIRFKNGYNNRDYQEATKIIDDIGWKLNTLDFDVIDYYKSGQASEFSQEIQCRQIAYLVIFQNILKLNSPTIMGGEIVFGRTPTIDGSKWYYSYRENEDGAAIRFSLRYNIPLVYEYFSYTPELIAYYMDHPRVKWLFSEKYNYKFNSSSTKNEILREFMPEIICALKLTGYEQLMGFNQETYLSLYQGDMVKYEPSLDGIYLDEFTRKLYN